MDNGDGWPESVTRNRCSFSCAVVWSYMSGVLGGQKSCFSFHFCYCLKAFAFEKKQKGQECKYTRSSAAAASVQLIAPTYHKEV